jgi:hypothetical protein
MVVKDVDPVHELETGPADRNKQLANGTAMKGPGN